MKNEKAIKILKEELKHTKSHLHDKDKAPEFFEELVDYCDAVKKAITAMEVFYGEWEPLSNDENDPRMICSRCKSIETPLARHNFCPNCGANMRGEKNERKIYSYRT